MRKLKSNSSNRMDCLPLVTSSRFGVCRLPRNLGMGQKQCSDRKIVGFGAMPTESQERPYVKRPTSSLRVYVVTLTAHFATSLRVPTTWPFKQTRKEMNLLTFLSFMPPCARCPPLACSGLPVITWQRGLMQRSGTVVGTRNRDSSRSRTSWPSASCSKLFRSGSCRRLELAPRRLQSADRSPLSAAP